MRLKGMKTGTKAPNAPKHREAPNSAPNRNHPQNRPHQRVHIRTFAHSTIRPTTSSSSSRSNNTSKTPSTPMLPQPPTKHLPHIYSMALSPGQLEPVGITFGTCSHQHRQRYRQCMYVECTYIYMCSIHMNGAIRLPARRHLCER